MAYKVSITLLLVSLLSACSYHVNNCELDNDSYNVKVAINYCGNRIVKLDTVLKTTDKKIINVLDEYKIYDKYQLDDIAYYEHSYNWYDNLFLAYLYDDTLDELKEYGFICAT